MGNVSVILTCTVRRFVLDSLLKMAVNCLLHGKKWLLAETGWSHFLLWYLFPLWNRRESGEILLSLVDLENFLVGRRQSCYYCFDVVSVHWHRFFRMLLSKCKIVLLDSNLLCPPFLEVKWLCKSLTGCSTQKCFWLPNYNSLVLCQPVSSS